MRRSSFFAGILAALFTFAAVSCANNASSEPSGPQNLPGSSDEQSEDLLGPDSKGGHLSLEAVEGGIKVTVRVLDGDIPEGKKLTSMDNFYIEETSTRIRLDLDKNKFLESAGDDRVNELSGIFPFTKADTDYKFEYVFDMQDNGYTFYPSTKDSAAKESAACKATSTGLSLEEYFDFDYAPDKAKVMVNDNGIMSINKDVSKFIKKDDATIYIEGSVVSGVYDWSDAEWCTRWESSIRNYKPGWRCRIDYKELFAGNADLGSIVLKNSYAVRTLCKRDTWFVNGNYKFSFPGIKTGFLMAINSASKGEEASSEMFKAPNLDNPFKGKTFKQSINQNNYGGYVINFIDDTTAYYGSESEVFAEYSYRVDSSKAKIYLETQKVNIDGTWLNREECIEMLRSEYPDTTDEQLNFMLLEGFSRNEIGYIYTRTGEVSFYGIMYDKPEDYLVSNIESIPVYEYYTYDSENLHLRLEGSHFEINRPPYKKDWGAISVNDGKITYTDENFKETFTISYEFKTNKVLTITYEGQSYDLSMGHTQLIGTLSDGNGTGNGGNDPAGGDGGEGSGAEDSGSKIESDLFIPENAPYDFGTGCEYDKGIGFDASSLKAGDIITLYYSLGTVENEYGVYSQLKISYGYSGTCLPSLKESANEYGQVLVEGSSYSFKLSEDDIAAISSSDGYNRMMIFGHNVILSKITKSDGSTTPDEPNPGDETVIKIENTFTGGASDITHNDDGSITGVSSAANSGQPLIVYINSDKTSVASGKTVKVVFDFAVESWSNDTLLPKFVVAAGLESEGWDLKGSDPAYLDAAAAKGSFEVPVVLKADSDVVKVQFNAWEWPGALDDSIKVTIKTIDVE